ncbi:MAG: metabolite traffic protein EboE [Micromonosporaceae bacterium]|nr:metabolite traffic protein EboE [Micromonosporaceae bacterium]
MRLTHRDGRLIHLGYCTNVHPAEDIPGILAQLDAYAVPVRAQLGCDLLGLGLWLSADVAAMLAGDPARTARLRRELTSRGLEVVTLNGFPYRAFQAPVVKHAVYRPDWTTPERLAYTLNLARVLAELLPEEADRGSVSTLPIGWRDGWDADQSAAAHRNLDALAGGLAQLATHTGRTVRVAIEPEPGCLVESTQDAVRELSTVDTEWLGVCLDLAHLACAWEEPAEALARLERAALPVVKVQISAALSVEHPGRAREALRQYVEPRFLHQTRGPDGRGTDDLGEALQAGLPGPWRVHYHVPLHAQPVPPLRATVPVAVAALEALLGGPVARCDHFEVETYTWDVLPEGHRPGTPQQLAAGIAGELAFARDQLTTVLGGRLPKRAAGREPAVRP